MTDAIHHLDLVVSDLKRSLEFYRGLLLGLGYRRESEITGERGERVVYLSRPGRDGSSLGLREMGREATTERPAGDYDRYAIGAHHIAFTARSREVVDERAHWLVEQGWRIESEPHEYDYSAGYYAMFCLDPDGIKLEIVHAPE